MPPRTPVQKRSVDRREALVAAAAWAIEEYGPADCSARTIAAAAGLPLASVTYYFPKVDDLLGLGAERVTAAWVDRGRRVQVEDTGVDAAARGLVAALLPAPGDRNGLMARYELVLSAARVAPIAVALGAARAGREQVIADILASARIRSDLEPGVLLDVVDGVALGSLADADADPGERVTTVLLQVLRG